METPQTIYQPEKKKEHLVLTKEQKETVRNITLGIEEVDEAIRLLAVDDVVATLENGHPLNRIVTNQEGNTVGFIACEDFVSHEAYIKYFGTSGQAGRNLFQEIPAFFEYAKQQGYTKLNFHGWNDRLNQALKHFGFERLRTDEMGGFSAGFYEKTLVEQKTSASITEARKQAFEKKYVNKLNQQYQQTLKTFAEVNRAKKEQVINETFQHLSARLKNVENFEFNDRQKIILKLKLARHFQRNETCDSNTLFDAIIESPKFLATDKGSLFKLFEVHEQKTLEKIAELRKQRAEMSGNEAYNPYENLFETKSGKYFLARLLNMPHLQEESEYMDHCVGTSDSYVNKMKRGEVEVLSFRHVPKVNPRTQRLEGDLPIMTIEYNRQTKTIEQIKKKNDQYLKKDDPFFSDLIDALKQLRTTETDTGEKRDFSKISSSELENIEVPDYHILTEQGEISFRDFDPEKNIFILKTGKMEIIPATTKEDASKIIRIMENIQCEPTEIAIGQKEISENTKIYIGPFFKDLLQKNIEHIYTKFPEGKISRFEAELGGEAKTEIIDELEKRKKSEGNDKIYLSGGAESMLKKPEFFVLEKKEWMYFVKLRVADLGFPDGATTEEIYQKAGDLGLELCPPETGPRIRLDYEKIFQKAQPSGEYFRIAMKQIFDAGGSPRVWLVHRDDDGKAWLHGHWAKPERRWDADYGFVFRFRKLDS